MNQQSLKILGAVIAVLALLYFVSRDEPVTSADGSLLLPELKQNLNDTREVGVRSNAGSMTIRRVDDNWVISDRNDYPADVGTLRSMLIALSEAKIVETKTSDPEKYALLGVDDPANEDSTAIELHIVGDAFEEKLLVGKVAQRTYRYARLADSEQSVLIDKNPEVAAEVRDWIVRDLLDIAASRVHKVTIEHADGERIEIAKESREGSDFSVLNIPDGRELSYATVANGIGGALAGLQLEDVRPASDGAPASAVATFETFDGLRIRFSTYPSGDESTDETWVALEAGVIKSIETTEDGGAESAAEGAAASGSDADGPAALEESQRIAAGTAGWEFRLPSFKANLLQRRFEDILKSEDSES